MIILKHEVTQSTTMALMTHKVWQQTKQEKEIGEEFTVAAESVFFFSFPVDFFF